MAKLRYYMRVNEGIWQEKTDLVWDGVLTYKSEEGSFYMKTDVKKEFVFIRSLYTEIVGYDDFDVLEIKVERLCGVTWEEFWSGTFYKAECQENRDQCKFTIRPKTTTDFDFDDFKRKLDYAVNFFSLPIIVVEPIQGEYQVECCTDTEVLESSLDPFMTCFELGDPSDWPVPLEGYEITSNADGTFTIVTCRHRIVAQGTCSGATPVPPDAFGVWVLLSDGDNCPTSSTWRRAPDDNTIFITFENGRDFNAMVEHVIDGLGAGLTVKSNFFGINPDGIHPSNIAYDYAEDFLRFMTIHQKADIKRPFDSDPSLSLAYDIKPKDLLNDLQVFFNVYWDIVGTDFILEHVSYFEKSVGLNCDANAMKLELQPDTGSTPKRELFYYMDELTSAVFHPQPIINPLGESDVEYRCRAISCDIGLISQTDNEASITDKGFVLISNAGPGTVRQLNDQNSPLRFPALHTNLHRHNRYYEASIVGGETALSWRRTKKQPAFTFCLQCSHGFDPKNLVSTPLGDGLVESADRDFQNDLLSLNLKYF